MRTGGGKFGRFFVVPRLIGDARLLVFMMKDWWSGEYRKVPYLTIGVMLFALFYVLNPFDLIPDTLIGPGQVDDAVILGLCLYLAERDLRPYGEWRLDRKGRNRPENP